MRNYCHHQWKIGYNFEMKRRIKILTTIWPNFCRLGVQNACTTPPNVHIEKEGKIEF